MHKGNASYQAHYACTRHYTYANMIAKKRFLYRLLFGVIPVLVVLICYLYYFKDDKSNLLEKIDLITVILILFLYILIIDLFKNLKSIKRKENLLIGPKLEDVPEKIEKITRINFLNRTININEKSIDLKSHDSLILHLNKEKKIVEVRNELRTKFLSFDDVEYIFLEYDQFQSYVPRIWIGITTGKDKTVYTNTFFAKMKDGKEVKMFDAKLKDYDLEVSEEHFLTGTYEERTYLSHGEKLIQLFSKYMDKKYFILDNC